MGEIRLCAFAIAPRGWAFCNGALMSISQNQALFSLLGTQYGGDGVVTFGLPDLRGRSPMHRNDSAYPQGATGGTETVTLTPSQIPQHNHIFNVTSSGAQALNAGNDKNMLLAASNLYSSTNPGISGPGAAVFATASTPVALHADTCGSTGGNQPHENMQPSLVMNHIIAITGIYPSRS